MFPPVEDEDDQCNVLAPNVYLSGLPNPRKTRVVSLMNAALQMFIAVPEITDELPVSNSSDHITQFVDTVRRVLCNAEVVANPNMIELDWWRELAGLPRILDDDDYNNDGGVCDEFARLDLSIGHGGGVPPSVTDTLVSMDCDIPPQPTQHHRKFPSSTRASTLLPGAGPADDAFESITSYDNVFNSLVEKVLAPCRIGRRFYSERIVDGVTVCTPKRKKRSAQAAAITTKQPSPLSKIMDFGSSNSIHNNVYQEESDAASSISTTKTTSNGFSAPSSLPLFPDTDSTFHTSTVSSASKSHPLTAAPTLSTTPTTTPGNFLDAISSLSLDSGSSSTLASAAEKERVASISSLASSASSVSTSSLTSSSLSSSPSSSLPRLQQTTHCAYTLTLPLSSYSPTETVPLITLLKSALKLPIPTPTYRGGSLTGWARRQQSSMSSRSAAVAANIESEIDAVGVGGKPIHSPQLFTRIPYLLTLIFQRPLVEGAEAFHRTAVEMPMDFDFGFGLDLKLASSSTSVSECEDASRSTLYRLHGFVTQTDGRFLTYTRLRGQYAWFKCEDEVVSEADLGFRVESKGVVAALYRLQLPRR